jgi:hypothetical protein
MRARGSSLRWVLVAITWLFVVRCGPYGDFREDELECEQAVARLTSCCPGFKPEAISCDYSTGCGITDYPALTIDESHCVQNESCPSLQGTGVCDRAQVAQPHEIDTITGDGGPSANPTVCP